MKPPPSLKTAMTPFPHSVERTAPLGEARAVMDQHNVHHLPVTEEHELVGLITDRGMRAALALPMSRGTVGKLTVKDVYIPDPYVVDLNEPLENVLLTMAERHIGSALVTRKGRLAGVFTAVDACRCFGEYLRENFPHPDGDEAA
jgi:acetoin utilization protein AcuB